jgi:hypothetical protein
MTDAACAFLPICPGDFEDLHMAVGEVFPVGDGEIIDDADVE